MQRNISIDILKLILSFFVVGLHLHFFDDVNREIGFFLNQGVFRLAVPLFLVINGYFFARIDNLNQYKKWLSRILFLYIFWLAIYSPFWFSKNMNSNIVTLFKGYFHLWYIIGIAYCSVIVYNLRKKNIKIIILIALFLYAIGVILQYAHVYNYINVPNFTYRNFLFFCMPFFSAGFVLKRLEIKNNKVTIDKYLVFSFALFLAEVVFNMLHMKKIMIFDINLSFIFLCPLLFCKINRIHSKLEIPNLALVSSAIYFIHPLVFMGISYFYELGSILHTFITILLSLFLAYPLIMLNRKIKIL